MEGVCLPFKNVLQRGVVGYSCVPSTLQAEAEDGEFEVRAAYPAYPVLDTVINIGGLWVGDVAQVKASVGPQLSHHQPKQQQPNKPTIGSALTFVKPAGW